MAYIVLKAQAAIAMNELTFPTMSTTTLGCSYTFFAESPMNMLAPNASAFTIVQPEK